MTDFILAALPWIAIAAAVALQAGHFHGRKKSQGDSKKPDADFMPYGTCLGMCIGVAIGAAFTERFGGIATTYGISFGLLVGVIVSFCINKLGQRNKRI
jgi:hypothetical protein